MKEPIVYTKNLIKNYGQGDSISKVLRGADINVYEGEFVIVFGPSGSGKSTLLNIISGLESPTEGQVVIDGQELTALSENEKARFHQSKLGMVFQAYNLIPSLTVMQNITLPLVFAQTSKAERENRAYELLKEFELEKLANRLPMEISGGQAQRVGIMRALVNRPPIIIADEPTGNLDSTATKKVMDLFSSLNERYRNTLIVVTHDSSLFPYADRIIFILDGQVIKETIRNRKEARPQQKEIIYDRVLKKESNKKKRKMLDVLAILLSRGHLASFDETELERTVELLVQRVDRKIDNEDLFQLLDKPINEGGAGLYQPTARHLADNFGNLLKFND